MIKLPLLFILLLSLSTAVFAQSDWQLTKSDDGILIYTRRVPSTKFKEVKVNFEVDGTADQLINVLQDVTHQNTWSYGTKSTRLIGKKGNDTILYYSEIALPWPLSNRDLVIQLSFAKDSLNHVLHIRAKSLSGVLPKYPDLVRIPYSLATWEVLQLPGKRLKIEYFLSADPGGALPGWLVNMGATVGPNNSFRKLREKIAQLNHHKPD